MRDKEPSIIQPEDQGDGVIQTVSDHIAKHRDSIEDETDKRLQTAVSPRAGMNMVLQGGPSILEGADAAPTTDGEKVKLRLTVGRSKSGLNGTGQKELSDHVKRSPGEVAPTVSVGVPPVEIPALGTEGRSGGRFADDEPRPRYGTVEKTTDARVEVEGGGGDAVASGNAPVFCADQDVLAQRGHRSIIQPADAVAHDMRAQISDATVSERRESAAELPDYVISGEERPLADQGKGKTYQTTKKDARSGGIIRRVGRKLGRESERALSYAGTEESVDTQAGLQYGKYAVRAGSVVGGSVITGVGLASRTALRGIKGVKDVRSGILTTKEAAIDVAGQTLRDGASGVGRGLGRAAASGATRAVADFHAGDDLGMKAITKPKDMVVGGYRAARAVNNVKRVLSNPVVLKSIAIVVAICILLPVLLSLISSVVSMVTTSVTTEDEDLNNAYLLVTKLDAEFEESFMEQDPPEDRWHEYQYFCDGARVTSVRIRTDADALLAYLDCKYDGNYRYIDVAAEIITIHGRLYSTRYETASREDENGSTIYIYKRKLYTTDLLTYLRGVDRSPDLWERYNAMMEVGSYTMRAELASPFPDYAWASSVTSRYGYRVHPIYGYVHAHKALDIAMAGGTPIHACMGGTAVVPGFHSSYGNYLKVIDSNGDYTLYAHMSRIAVTDGDTIQTGDVIGYVGTTGDSTGNHLHLEYHKNGQNLNPWFFVAR